MLPQFGGRFRFRTGRTAEFNRVTNTLNTTRNRVSRFHHHFPRNGLRVAKGFFNRIDRTDRNSRGIESTDPVFGGMLREYGLDFVGKFLLVH